MSKTFQTTTKKNPPFFYIPTPCTMSFNTKNKITIKYNTALRRSNSCFLLFLTKEKCFQLLYIAMLTIIGPILSVWLTILRETIKLKLNQKIKIRNYKLKLKIYQLLPKTERTSTIILRIRKKAIIQVKLRVKRTRKSNPKTILK
jgi:hypothetical protein